MKYKVNLEYKGFICNEVENESDYKMLTGSIENIKDYVGFHVDYDESPNDGINKLEKEFKDAVECYLELCEIVNKEPDFKEN